MQHLDTKDQLTEDDPFTSYPNTTLSESTPVKTLHQGDVMEEISYTYRLPPNISLWEIFPTNEEAVPEGGKIFLAVIYSIAALLSLLGNITVIVVLATGKRSSLQCYLINLAVSDISMAVFCIPFSFTNFLLNRWIFAPEFCKIVMFMQHFSVTTSVYTLVAVGIDRHKALIHPLHPRWTKTKTKLVVMIIWIFSFLVSAVQLVVSSADFVDGWNGGEGYYMCLENWPRTPGNVYEKAYTVVVFLVTFALPVMGLSYTYISIIFMMCSYRLPGNSNPSREDPRLRAKVKVIYMMIAIVVCFIISWLPLQTLQFIYYFAPSLTECYSSKQCIYYHAAFFTCHWIAMANSFMNPFIYCFMSKNFREDLIQTLRMLRKCSHGEDFRHQRTHIWNRSELGSSFRSILYITRRTSVKSSPRASLKKNVKDEDAFELKPLKKTQFKPATSYSCPANDVNKSTAKPVGSCSSAGDTSVAIVLINDAANATPQQHT